MEKKKEDEEKESTSERAIDEEEVLLEDGEIERNEEEIEREKKRHEEWDKLIDFLRCHSDQMIDVLSFNASTNLYDNDVANLAIITNNHSIVTYIDPPHDYENRVSLIDLKTSNDKCLFSMSWHYELKNILACVYLDRYAKKMSLITLWSLDYPLRPRMLLKCEDKVSIVEFCPRIDYTDIIVGGCIDGKIVVWEIDRRNVFSKYVFYM